MFMQNPFAMFLLNSKTRVSIISYAFDSCDFTVFANSVAANSEGARSLSYS